MHHKVRKRFGQHFLQDDTIVQRMINSMALTPPDAVIEIGPGLGAMTVPLLQRLERLTVVEIDRDLIAHLRQLAPPDRLTIIQADVLRVDIQSLTMAQSTKVVGNLPYNISTPLLFHLLQASANIEGMWFMLQHEVAQRLAAQPGESAYGRLSVMAQYHCRVEYLFSVPPQAFAPPPKVDSAVVYLQPYRQLPYQAKDYTQFSQLVTAAFNQRRKTIKNALKNRIDNTTFASLNIDPGARAEELSLAQYVMLSNHAEIKV
jgi:16S rRNA (adenine1518-N6/adenine1519-N6)-dimethyltransferase